MLNFCILQKPENDLGEAETSFLEMCFFSQNAHSLVLYVNRFSLGDYPNYRNYDLSGPVRASAEKKKKERCLYKGGTQWGEQERNINHLLIVHASFATNRSGEGLTLETSVFKLFSYGGQFTLSTQLLILNYPKTLCAY